MAGWMSWFRRATWFGVRRFLMMTAPEAERAVRMGEGPAEAGTWGISGLTLVVVVEDMMAGLGRRVVE